MSTICCIAAARLGIFPSLLQKLRGLSSASDEPGRVIEALKAAVDKEVTATVEETKFNKLADMTGSHQVAVDGEIFWKKLLLEHLPAEISNATWTEVAVISTVMLNVLTLLRKQYVESLANEAGKLTVEQFGKSLDRRRHGAKDAALEKKVDELLEKVNGPGKYIGVNEASGVEMKLGELLERLRKLEASPNESLYQRVCARFEVGEFVKVGDVKGYIAEIGVTNVKLKMPEEDEESAFVDLPLSDFEGKVFQLKAPTDEPSGKR